MKTDIIGPLYINDVIKYLRGVRTIHTSVYLPVGAVLLSSVGTGLHTVVKTPRMPPLGRHATDNFLVQMGLIYISPQVRITLDASPKPAQDSTNFI